MENKKISFSEELLSGFLDGELSAEKAEKVRQFALSSVDIREDLSSLARVGELLSSNFNSSPEELNTWEAIQGKLSAKVPQAVQKVVIEQESGGASAASRIWNWIFSPGFGAALALGLFAVGMLSSQWIELPSGGVIASNEGSRDRNVSQSDIALEGKEVLVPLIQKRLPGTNQTFVSNGFTAGQTNGFNYSPQFISPQQLSVEHPARSTGVRADGMQIEWMKNSKSVRFLRHKNSALPPMIWLGDLK